MATNNSVNQLIVSDQFSTVGNSTWTKPNGVETVYVVCVGGGGGGGGGAGAASLNIRHGGG